MKSLLTGLFLSFALTTAAQAANVITHGDTEARSLWSNVCIGNLEIEQPLDVEYRYGDAEEWETVTMEPGQIWLFRQSFNDGGRPNAFAIRFDSDLTDDGVESIEAILDGNITRLRQTDCDNSHYLEFQSNPARDGTIILQSMN